MIRAVPMKMVKMTYTCGGSTGNGGGAAGGDFGVYCGEGGDNGEDGGGGNNGGDGAGGDGAGGESGSRGSGGGDACNWVGGGDGGGLAEHLAPFGPVNS